MPSARCAKQMGPNGASVMNKSQLWPYSSFYGVAQVMIGEAISVLELKALLREKEATLRDSPTKIRIVHAHS
jgi:hypothetical protein